MKKEDKKMRYVLGLDIGVQSVGWAVVPILKSEFHKLRVGVRCFESGTGTESDIESGKDASRNVARRMARGVRRNQHRRTMRAKTLFHRLQEGGWLPGGDFRLPEERHRILTELDNQLRIFCPPDDRVAAHLLPYILRKR